MIIAGCLFVWGLTRRGSRIDIYVNVLHQVSKNRSLDILLNISCLPHRDVIDILEKLLNILTFNVFNTKLTIDLNEGLKVYIKKSVL